MKLTGRIQISSILTGSVMKTRARSFQEHTFRSGWDLELALVIFYNSFKFPNHVKIFPSHIGSRFALMEAKLVLFELFSRFSVVKTEKTPASINYKPSVVFRIEPKIYLNFNLRN
jgi:hypothetical protein